MSASTFDGVAGMQAATGDQPLGIFPDVLGDELVDARGEADDFRRHVVDEHGAVDAGVIQCFRKAFGERQNSAI